MPFWGDVYFRGRVVSGAFGTTQVDVKHPVAMFTSLACRHPGRARSLSSFGIGRPRPEPWPRGGQQRALCDAWGAQPSARSEQRLRWVLLVSCRMTPIPGLGFRFVAPWTEKVVSVLQRARGSRPNLQAETWRTTTGWRWTGNSGSSAETSLKLTRRPHVQGVLGGFDMVAAPKPHHKNSVFSDPAPGMF